MSGLFKALQIRNFIKIAAVVPKLRRFCWDTCSSIFHQIIQSLNKREIGILWGSTLFFCVQCAVCSVQCSVCSVQLGIELYYNQILIFMKILIKIQILIQILIKILFDINVDFEIDLDLMMIQILTLISIFNVDFDQDYDEDVEFDLIMILILIWLLYYSISLFVPTATASLCNSCPSKTAKSNTNKS